jgi:folate-binding protein YgfZ
MSDAIILGDIDAEATDKAVAAHYGDPMREQRTLETGAGVVDRSNREIIAITGPERLSWLHNITTQHLLSLQPGQGTEMLILSPHGHVEHHVVLADDGVTTWLDAEPGDGADLLDFLLKMRFMARAELVDVSADWALLSLTGPDAEAALRKIGVEIPAAPEMQAVPGPKFASSEIAPRPTTVYSTTPLPGGGWVRRHEDRFDLLAPRGDVERLVGELDVPRAGIWAYEALRVAARRARQGFETDHRTIAAEIDLLGPAVHLDKGCYRGQETVARVHNLGRPPRRLVLLHLDGITSDEPPAPGTPVLGEDGRAVGFVGTAARHHELGLVALALIKRNVADDAHLKVGESAAAIDPQ